MNRTSSKFLPIRRALTATALTGAALARFGAPLAQASEQVTVVAPRVTQKVIGYSFALGAPIERVSLSRDVSYANLDLAKTTGANALKARVAEAAHEDCTELGALYPAHSSSTTCVRNAIKGGMKQADRAIATAIN